MARSSARAGVLHRREGLRGNNGRGIIRKAGAAGSTATRSQKGGEGGGKGGKIHTQKSLLSSILLTWGGGGEGGGYSNAAFNCIYRVLEDFSFVLVILLTFAHSLENQSFFYISGLFTIEIMMRERESNVLSMKVICALEKEKKNSTSSFPLVNSSADDVPSSHGLK